MTDQNALLQLGQEHHKSGNLQSAAEIYQQVLTSNPANEEGLYLLGCLAHQTSNRHAAIDLLRKATVVNAQQADYQHALATALFSSGFEQEAEFYIRQAIQLESRPDFYRSLVILLKKQDRVTDVLERFKQAPGVTPHQAITLSDLPQLPNNEQAQCDFADALLDTGDSTGASVIYSAVLTHNPRLERAWYSAGCAQETQKEYSQAADCFQKAVDLRPDWPEARHNLARSLYELGQVGPAFEQFKLCGAQPNEQSKYARAMMAVIVPGVPGVDHQTILDVRRNWIQSDLAPTNQPREAPSFNPADRLRVAYISSFFHRDNWMKPVWGLINQHDRNAFEISLFSDAPRTAIHQGYRPHQSDRFIETSNLSNKALATLIRNRDVDILVDLNGYSNPKRLPIFMNRPAPVIIGWFNMYATTGMDAFDYLIGDDHVILTREEQFYTEKILRVKGSYLTFEVSYPVPPITDPPCLRKGTITFGSLGSQYKITAEVVAAWSQILRNVPASSLLLKNKQLASESTRKFMLELFASQGITRDRIQSGRTVCLR